jgi:hypothetical protein
MQTLSQLCLRLAKRDCCHYHEATIVLLSDAVAIALVHSSASATFVGRFMHTTTVWHTSHAHSGNGQKAIDRYLPVLMHFSDACTSFDWSAAAFARSCLRASAPVNSQAGFPDAPLGPKTLDGRCPAESWQVGPSHNSIH